MYGKSGYTHMTLIRQLSENQDLKIPTFQRGLEWTDAQALKLLDSVMRGYPISCLLMWERNDVTWVLDGQQRLSVLSGMRPGTNEPGPVVWWDIDQRCWSVGPRPDGGDMTSISIAEYNAMGTFERVKWFQRLDPAESSEDRERAVAVIGAFDELHCTTVPVHVLGREATLEDARESFRRLNGEGVPINLDRLEALMQNEGI